jgi:hypothetical protein
VRLDPGGGPPRVAPAALPGITGVRFLPQRTEATLVNISPSGLLVESTAKYQVGSAAAVLFEGGFSPATATGRVVRCEVAVMGRDGVLRYYIGIEFDAPLDLGEAAGTTAAAPAVPSVRNRW